MPDVKISALPAATSVSDTDVFVINQGSPTATTKKVTFDKMLPAVAVNTGQFGSDSQVAQVTVDSKGRVTAAANVAINASNISTGTLPVNHGGTGAATLAANGYIKGNGTSALTSQTGVPATDLTGTIVAANMPALSGDVTSTAGSTATTLASTGVTAGSYGSSSQVAQLTLDAKGRATAVSNASITPAAIGAVAKTGDTMSGGLSVTGGSFFLPPLTGGSIPLTVQTGAFNSQTAFRVEALGPGKGILIEKVAQFGGASTDNCLEISNGGTGNSISITGATSFVVEQSGDTAIGAASAGGKRLYVSGNAQVTGSLTASSVIFPSGTQTAPFKPVQGSVLYNGSTLTAGTNIIINIAITGAIIGLPAIASLSVGFSASTALMLSAHVYAAGQATVVIRNVGSTSITIPACTVYATALL